jgi:hypothetical protein
LLLPGPAFSLKWWLVATFKLIFFSIVVGLPGLSLVDSAGLDFLPEESR